MLIEILMVLFIIGLLYAGPTFENIWVAIAVYGGIIAGMILALWYSGRLSGGVAGFLLGGTAAGKVKETYDLAEKYEVEHRFEEAIAIYQGAFANDKKNPAPRIRLADLYYHLEDYDNCIKYMREALGLAASMPESERVSLMNRLADVHLQKKRDAPSAIAILNRVVEEFPKTKYALYARERIIELKRDERGIS
ncbi:MAG: tetratricopeptide repeat protein [Candidatus Lindowbacteria bacterium]|nr:tetratricopeptide repeat protein [Candidatus Lindowbacteria bacterium]